MRRTGEGTVMRRTGEGTVMRRTGEGTVSDDLTSSKSLIMSNKKSV